MTFGCQLAAVKLENPVFQFDAVLNFLVALEGLVVVVDLGVVVAQTHPCFPALGVELEHLLVVIEGLLVLGHLEIELGPEAVALLEFVILPEGLINSLHGFGQIIHLIVGHGEQQVDLTGAGQLGARVYDQLAVVGVAGLVGFPGAQVLLEPEDCLAVLLDVHVGHGTQVQGFLVVGVVGEVLLEVVDGGLQVAGLVVVLFGSNQQPRVVVIGLNFTQTAIRGIYFVRCLALGGQQGKITAMLVRAHWQLWDDLIVFMNTFLLLGKIYESTHMRTPPSNASILNVT